MRMFGNTSSPERSMENIYLSRWKIMLQQHKSYFDISCLDGPGRLVKKNLKLKANLRLSQSLYKNDCIFTGC